MSGHAGRWRAPGAALLAVLVLAVAVVVLSAGRVTVDARATTPRATDSTVPAGYAQLQQERCGRLTTSLRRYGEVRDFGSTGPHIGVIGDSYTSGQGLKDRSQRWVAHLADLVPARVRADGVGFSGFVSDGPCGGQRYATRAERVQGQEIVLIEGGLNDLWATDDQVVTAAIDLVGRFPSARVIVIGPVDIPARSGEREVDTALATASIAAGAEYVSMLPLHPTFASDGIHLSPAGHFAFGRRIAAYLHHGMR